MSLSLVDGLINETNQAQPLKLLEFFNKLDPIKLA